MVPTPTVTRRSFLKAMFAACAAPAIVSAASLMPIYVPPKRIIADSELKLVNNLFVDRCGFPPGNVPRGHMYFNTSDETIYLYSGVSWIPLRPPPKVSPAASKMYA